MPLALQVQAIIDGLFNYNFPPDQLNQVHDSGTERVVNWRRVRPAVVALQDMDWYDIDLQWNFFLDTDRYPVGQQMDLGPQEAQTFERIVNNLIDEAREGMRILSSVQPKISLTDVSVVVNSHDLETLENAIRHIRLTADIAAIDDAITVSSLQPGSLEIILTSGKVSLYGLQLAILLAKLLKDPRTNETVRSLRRLWSRLRPDDDVTEEAALETVHEDAKENFWEHAEGSLKTAVEGVGKILPEAKSKVDRAAHEIYHNADQVAVEWKLPPAVITGLPGGIAVSLNYEDPESIGRVIRAIAAPPEGNGKDD